MQPLVIAPSILSANLASLGDDVAAVLAAGADWVHFDVMDNHYVPNLAFGPDVCKALRTYGITAPIDVHLMITPVDGMIVPFAAAGATSISFHPDATQDVAATINLIKDNNCKVGIALKPEVSLDILPSLRHKIDMLLLMSVHPGFGGQKLLPQVLEKVVQARRILDSWDTAVRLQIDGGVNLETIHAVAATGVDTVVAGVVFRYKAEAYKDIISQLRSSFNKG